MTEDATLLAQVGRVLGSSLDLHHNVGRLAELVVPSLGTWSIVTVADEHSDFVDLGRGTPTRPVVGSWPSSRRRDWAR